MASISVIIPAYQCEKTIKACIHSVLAQSLRPHEVIVVNDGSSDTTESCVLSFGTEIIYLTQENKGGNAARNRGFDVSHGEFVIFCDADVIMAHNMLERMHDVLVSQKSTSYAYSGFRFGWKAFPSFPYNPERLKQHNYIHTTSLIRRAHFSRFDESLKRFQDWDLWLTMLEEAHFGMYINEEMFRVLTPRGRSGISHWQPSIFYRIPWEYLLWTPPAVLQYKVAQRVIFQKHDLV